MIVEINELQRKVVKYEIFVGVFISILLAVIFSFKVSASYLLGTIVSLANFIMSVYVFNKWLGKKNCYILISSLFRVIFVGVMAIPFINNLKLLIAYLLAYIIHLICMSSSVVSKKGSA